jgi:Flp pilus assembly protein TadG
MIAVLSAALFVVLLAMVAFAVDIGYFAMVKTQLQAAADSAALASAAASNQTRDGMVRVAQAFAQYHWVGNRPVVLNAGDVQFGMWNPAASEDQRFVAMTTGLGTAVKVTVRADDSSGGRSPLFFGHVLGATAPAERASAVATVNPRDIAFVVDLSGTMNWDTAPDQGTSVDSLKRQVYADFGFETYPGTTATRTSTLLTNMQRAAGVMPNAVPAIITDSNDSRYAASSGYWSNYFNWLAWKGESISYKSYVEYMMENGRDVQRGGYYSAMSANYTPLFAGETDPAQRRYESTDAGWFYFPAREMPSHAIRRAIIDALKIIEDRNAAIVDSNLKDKVALVTFDVASQCVIKKPLTGNYRDVMDACRTLQACGTNDAANRSRVSTDSEGGIIAARNHIRAISEGGVGRENANKVIVFLTDGEPNIKDTANNVIDQYKLTNPGGWGSSYEQNAALMQAQQVQGKNWSLYAVGVGARGKQDFMDLVAKKAGTTVTRDDGTVGAYAIAADSATYEENVKAIFNSIINNPKLRLVQ